MIANANKEPKRNGYTGLSNMGRMTKAVARKGIAQSQQDRIDEAKKRAERIAKAREKQLKTKKEMNNGLVTDSCHHCD